MIQDGEAFRLFFLAAAADVDAPDEKERQRAMLSSAQFNDNELAIASTVLSDFKRQYDAAVQKYNDAVGVARSPEQLPDGKQW